ncbi:MAG: hypothetical protein JWP34_3739 [Massilia sp.]|nr:hypothetical protein [Massilia sp.]
MIPTWSEPPALAMRTQEGFVFSENCCQHRSFRILMRARRCGHEAFSCQGADFEPRAGHKSPPNADEHCSSRRQRRPRLRLRGHCPKRLLESCRLRVRQKCADGRRACRAGADGLSLDVQQALGHVPCDGTAYVFSNKRRTRLKLACWDGNGDWLCVRRLHRGQFTWPQAHAEEAIGEDFAGTRRPWARPGMAAKRCGSLSRSTHRTESVSGPPWRANSTGDVLHAMTL